MTAATTTTGGAYYVGITDNNEHVTLAHYPLADVEDVRVGELTVIEAHRLAARLLFSARMVEEMAKRRATA